MTEPPAGGLSGAMSPPFRPQIKPLATGRSREPDRHRSGSRTHRTSRRQDREMTAATLPPNGDEFAEIRSVAAALAGAAFSALEEDHVVPPSRYRPFLRVGRDYEGGDVNVPEFARLCELLDAAFPDRFGLPLGAPGRQFANHWAYSFIEACIARCSRNDEAFETTARGVEDSVAELLAALRSSDGVVAACRLASHVTTSDGAPIDLLGVHIVPAEFRGGIFEEVARHIPGGYSAFNGDEPWPMAQPLSILTVED